MKKIFLAAAAFLCTHAVQAQNIPQLSTIVNGEFSAGYISGITPMQQGEFYTQISKDRKQILQYSFKTGKQVGVLFDISDTQGERINDFDGYIMSPDEKKMLIRTKTQAVYRRSYKAVYYIYNIESHKLEKLSQGGPQQVPTWSPDNHTIAFVRDNNIFLIKLLYDNAETQVTKDGEFNHVINGIPDWVYEEEFSYNKALAFTADGSMVCWARFDESQVKTYTMQLFKGLKPELKSYTTYPGTYTYKYPKAGEQNSKVTIWSYDIASRKTNQLQVPVGSDDYIPRILPTQNPEEVIVCTMNRHQNKLDLYTVNPRTTLSKLLIRQENEKYIPENALTNLHITKNRILMTDDRSGNTQIQLYDTNGNNLRTVGGKYEITGIYGYDEAKDDIYFQAALPNATERQVMVSHKNGKTESLTPKQGWNEALFSSDYKYFINTWSDCNTPYVYTVNDNRGKVLTTLMDNADLKNKLAAMQIPAKEFFQMTTSENVTLNGWMVKPSNFDPHHKYPVILFQYSGPGSQQVVNSWHIGSVRSGALFEHYLAQQGFIVACVDGRGTGGRGADFEKCIYLNLGKLESTDQVEAAIYMGKLPYVDSSKIGIWGWSFGGFNTLMSMSEGRPVFAAGVAVAAPTDFRFYDTVYTERYMRTPNENQSGYDINPIKRVSKLHGALLLCHGVADDNVHIQNAFEYSEALVQADKDFRELIYTNRNHGIRGGNTTQHLLRQITGFFTQHLK